jgi:hypothetical protein
MDASRFDRWVAAVGHRRTRRTTLRLLGSALLGALLPGSRSEVARAAQIDVAGPPPAGVSLVDCAAQGLTDCGGYCTNLSSDTRNCGGCGIYCSADQLCANGVCQLSAVVAYPPPIAGASIVDCAAQGLTNCNHICTDLLTDQDNCGGCDIYCIGEQVCDNGVCRQSATVLAAPCAAQGLTDCGDGICRDLNSNHEFCGSCNYRCRDGYDCVNGACV